jgi:uncharacterized protein YjhX (UPF0386 family)
MKKYLLTACISLFILYSYAQTARVADTQKKNNGNVTAVQTSSEERMLQKDKDIPVASQLKGHKQETKEQSITSEDTNVPVASQLKEKNVQPIQQPATKDEKQKLPKN